MTAPPAPEAPLRVSDADRDRVEAALRHHAADGRITLDEYGDRLGEAYAARTAGELAAALRGLPRIDVVDVAAGAAAGTRGRPRRRPEEGAGVGPLVLWLTLSVLFVGVWAASGAAFFWPVFPILGVGSKLLAGRGGAWGHPGWGPRTGCGARSRGRDGATA